MAGTGLFIIGDCESQSSPLPKKVGTALVMVANGRNYYFQESWLNTFPWARLENEKLFCSSCQEAIRLKLFPPSTKLNGTFTEHGFQNWKKGVEYLKQHQRSDPHVLATVKLEGMKGTPINRVMSDAISKQQQVARDGLKAIVTSLIYLGQNGLAIRGHENDEGNFQSLLRLRAQDNEPLRSWLKEGLTFTSWKCQDEILKIVAHNILRQQINIIKSCGQFCLIVDETADVSGKEQLSVCIRVVDENLEPQEIFLGLYEVGSTTADSLRKVVLDVLARFDLKIQDVRAQCYDGATNMAGVHKGLAAQISKLEPRAVYVHCHAHCLNLAIQDTVQAVSALRDVMGNVHELATTVKASPKR